MTWWLWLLIGGIIGATVGVCGTCLLVAAKCEYPLQGMDDELRQWLDNQRITSDNVTAIKVQLCMPWASEWNALVRSETNRRCRLDISSDSTEI